MARRFTPCSVGCVMLPMLSTQWFVLVSFPDPLQSGSGNETSFVSFHSGRTSSYMHTPDSCDV